MGRIMVTRDQDLAVFDRQFDPRRPGGFLQRRVEHDNGSGRGEPRIRPSPFLVPTAADLQAAALALDGRPVRQLRVHRLEVGVDVVDADAGLVAGVLPEVCPAAAALT